MGSIHDHIIVDSDTHFIIDPKTRAITNTSGKVSLIQYDHNSERFSFEIDTSIEGHDMLQTSEIVIHYTNIDSATRMQHPGTYKVTDAKTDTENPNKLVFSWLVSENATLYSGSLSFVVIFSCYETVTETTIDEDGNEVEITKDKTIYRWGTDVHNAITIKAGMNNTEVVIETYDDLLLAWKQDIDALLTERKEENDALLSEWKEENDAAIDDCRGFVTDNDVAIKGILADANILKTIEITEEFIERKTANGANIVDGQPVKYITVKGKTSVDDVYRFNHATFGGLVSDDETYTNSNAISFEPIELAELDTFDMSTGILTKRTGHLALGGSCVEQIGGFDMVNDTYDTFVIGVFDQTNLPKSSDFTLNMTEYYGYTFGGDDVGVRINETNNTVEFYSRKTTFSESVGGWDNISSFVTQFAYALEIEYELAVPTTEKISIDQTYYTAYKDGTERVLGYDVVYAFAPLPTITIKYILDEVGEITGGSSIEVVQETGDSETAVMSQKATTDVISAMESNLGGIADNADEALNTANTAAEQASIANNKATQAAEALEGKLNTSYRSTNAPFGGDGTDFVFIAKSVKSGEFVEITSKALPTGDIGISPALFYNGNLYLPSNSNNLNMNDAYAVSGNRIKNKLTIYTTEAPTTSTVGYFVGQMCVDTVNQKTYQLMAFDNTNKVYTWKSLDDGGGSNIEWVTNTKLTLSNVADEDILAIAICLGFEGVGLNNNFIVKNGGSDFVQQVTDGDKFYSVYGNVNRVDDEDPRFYYATINFTSEGAPSSTLKADITGILIKK